MNQGLERHLAAEYVPSAENRPLGEISGLMHLPVSSRVPSIHVTKGTGVDHRMVEGRIEYDPVLCTSSFHLYPGKFPVPQGDSLPVNVIE